jgi:hypothetical protein
LRRVAEEAASLAKDLGRQQPPPFRLAMSEYLNAAEDLETLRAFTRFGQRAAVENLTWRRREREEGFIHDSVWANGKVVAYGTSWAQHLATVDTLRQRYRSILEELEQSSRLRWEEGAYAGSNAQVDLSASEVYDPRALLESVTSGREPFRLLGQVRETEQGWAASAIDLHTRGRVALEMHGFVLNIYLSSDACANIFLRLLVNLEHYLSAGITSSADSLMSA